MAINFILMAISFFFIVMLLVVVFLIATKVSIKAQSKKVNNLFKRIQPLVHNHVKELKNQPPDEKELKEVKRLIHSYIGIEAFNKVWDELIQDPALKESLKVYGEEVFDFQFFLKKGVLKIEDNIKREYVLHLLGKFGNSNKEALEFAFKSLGASSTNIRNAALRVIENSKDPEDIVRVYEIITKDKTFFNNKVMIDFVDSFRGVHSELNFLLMKKLETFNEMLQVSIIEHFINGNFKVADEEILRLAGESSSKEVKIVALKYFKVYSNSKALKFILHSLKEESYEVRAIAAAAAASYPKGESLQGLRWSISDPSWFVRFNSAFSILNIENKAYGESEVVSEILNGSDKYAKEIMVYALFAKNIIDIERYNTMVANMKEIEG